MKLNLLRMLAVALVLTGAATAARAAQRSLADFFGEYKGEAVSVIEGEVAPRNLGIVIRPDDRGFVLTWSTTIFRQGRVKERNYVVRFHPNKDNPLIFVADMVKDESGAWQPAEPVKGYPFAWAQLTGDTMSVYATVVLDEGSHETQVYDRTLTDQGMSIAFSRVRDGKASKVMTGTLKRIAE